MRRLRLVLLLILLTGLAGCAHAPATPAPPRTDVVRRVSCPGGPMEYVLSVPEGAPSRPAVLLLHGAGDRMDRLVALWREVADAEGLVLVSPQLPRTLDFEAAAPGLFGCVLDDARAAAPFDARRVWVFGFSMGGYLAFDAVLLDSARYAAAAVYESGIAPDYEGLVGKAPRKVPVALYAGGLDTLITPVFVRHTRDLLERAGFPLRYQELPLNEHRLGRDEAPLLREVAKFFARQPPAP